MKKELDPSVDLLIDALLEAEIERLIKIKEGKEPIQNNCKIVKLEFVNRPKS